MTTKNNESRSPTVVSLALLALAALAILSLSVGSAAAQSSTFDVTINATNEPVTEGDTLEVEVVVENTGGETDSQELNLTTDNGTGTVERDTETVALDPGASSTLNLTWDTESGDAGDYDIEVASETDFESGDVTVTDVAEFDVDIDSTNEPVREGETLLVDATVENDGGATDTQDIELELDGRERDSETVQLDEDESESITLEWETDASDAGDYQANVSSETDTASTNVEVNAGPTAAFTRDPATPNVNEAVVFDASDSSDPDGNIVEYTWEIDGENVSSAESPSYTFTEAGDHEVRLYVTDDDGVTATTTRTVTVNAPPTVSVPEVDATVDEEVTVEPDVSDDGEISRYEWYVDGELVTTDRTLTYTFSESGTRQVRLVVTDDDGATQATTRTVRVESDETPTATPTPTVSPVDQPGFGAAVALVALLCAALLAGRE